MAPPNAASRRNELATVTTMKFRVLLVGLLVASAGPLGANARLSMKVSPAVAFAPADLTMRATIAPDSRNRMLQITAESGDDYRSSDIQLAGERAPRTTLVYFRSVPGGVYQVSALLTDERGEELALAQYDITSVESGVTQR
jgi:hypothetical protein